jgi:ketosteroid isomerase-like protein
MNSHTLRPWIILVLAIGWPTGSPNVNAAESKSVAESNNLLIQSSFDRWRAGTGGPFELLAPDATWTITGHSLVAKKYATRDEFLDTVIKPFNARMSKPLVPTIRNLYSDGDTVIALFDAEATALDGKPYRNTYAWFMQMREGRIVTVTAFFDALEFNDLWRRVAPRSNL